MKVVILSIPGAFIFWYITVGLLEGQWGKRNDICAIWLMLTNPNLSTCRKCGVPWNHCEAKVIDWASGRGTFAICKYCWDRSTLMERKTYYAKCYFGQVDQGMEDDHFCELMDGVVKESKK